MAEYPGQESTAAVAVKVEGEHPRASDPAQLPATWSVDPRFSADLSVLNQLTDSADALGHSDEQVLGRTIRRGRVPEHPCWDFMQRFPHDNYMNCRLCGRSIVWVNTRNAMLHLRNAHPETVDELERTWQSRLQLRSEVNRFSEDSSQARGSSEPLKKRGRATEHPSWLYFERIDKKGANCRVCGVHVAYACSGNLMKHLKSRHVAEFVIAQKDWDDILKRKRQLCEIRLMASAAGASGEVCGEPPVFDIDDDDLDETISDRASQNGTDYGDGDERSPLGEKDSAAKESAEPESKGGASEASTSRCESQPTVSATAESLPKSSPAVPNVSEALHKILLSLGTERRVESVPSYAPAPPSFSRYGDFSCRSDRTPPPVARRIQSFLMSLADDLISFSPEKSLLCMRQIRKYMDEKLLEKEGCASRSDDDGSIL